MNARATLFSVFHQSQSETRAAAVNFSWLLGERILRVVVGLVVSVAVARYLGPAQFGILSFALSLTAVFTAITGFGLDDLMVRNLAVQPRRAGTLLSAGMQIRLVAAVLSYTGLVIAAFTIRPGVTEVWVVVTITGAAMFFSPVDLVDCWFRSIRNARAPVLARQSALLLAAAGRIGLVAAGASLNAFAVAFLVEGALVALALTWTFVRSAHRPILARPEKWQRTRLLVESWPLMCSGLLVLLTMQADRLLLARLSSDAEVGLYAAAARLTEVFYAVPIALGAAVLPRLTTLKLEDPGRYWVLARRGILGLGALGAAIAFVLAVMAEWMVPWLYGRDYAEAASVLRVHAWTLGFVFLVSLRSRLLVIEGCTGWLLGMSVLTAVLNIGANFYLIPRHGATGAAFAATGAWAFSALVAPLFFSRTRQLVYSLAHGASKPGHRADE